MSGGSTTGPGERRFVVSAGMLHSQPAGSASSLRALAGEGVSRVIAIVLAPQYSPLILTGYQRALDAAVAEVAPALPVRLAGAWHTTGSWVASLAARVVDSAAARSTPPTAPGSASSSPRTACRAASWSATPATWRR